MTTSDTPSKKCIAIFASGSGTNAQKIMTHFQANPHIDISLVLSNKTDAKVLERAAQFNIPSFVFNRNDFYETDVVLNKLNAHHIHFIVLAGFLWLIPSKLINAYPNRIINIHPALLPQFGGKNMYGMHVHRAVKEAGVKETGITIHYVNARYDEGEIIFQAKCTVDEKDTPDTIAQKVQALEHLYYPQIIERILSGTLQKQSV